MTRTLPLGVIPQLYMDKVHSRAELATQLGGFYRLGARAVAFHGFSTTLPKQWPDLALLAHNLGLSALAAFGMDSDDPRGKAERIASVATRDDCAGVICDAEGKWEDQTSDRATAAAFGTRLRELAPDALVIDQPWFAPASHWTLFPWEEFARVCDVRAPQVYVNDFTRQFGKDRCAKVFVWYERDWAKLEARLAPQNLVRPRIPTIQAYGWQDIASDLDDVLARFPTVIAWAEPYPDTTFMAAWRRLADRAPVCAKGA